MLKTEVQLLFTVSILLHKGMFVSVVKISPAVLLRSSQHFAVTLENHASTTKCVNSIKG